jgi:hypothetical protein
VARLATRQYASGRWLLIVTGRLEPLDTPRLVLNGFSDEISHSVHLPDCWSET